jgi:RNA polymerase sigma-70 factor, ECF subfamily
VSALEHRTDEQLIRAVSRGDDQAFEVLVERHGSAIKAYSLRMLRSAELAEEVYTETFLRVLEARGRSWQARGTVRGYLFTIAHRLCLDELRRRKTRREAAPGLVALAESRPVRPSPEATAVLGQRADRMEEALLALPEEHRTVLLLRVVHGLSAAETGRATGLTEEQVHSQVSYARKRLRELLVEPAERSVIAGGRR